MRLISACIFSLVLVSVVSQDLQTEESARLLQTSVDNLKVTFGCSASLGGFNFDMSSLTSTTDFSAKDTAYDANKYMYYFNPCGVANSNALKCITGSATFCQITGANTGAANLGTCTTPPGGTQPASPVWELINPLIPAVGLRVTYANGDSCGAGTPPTKIGVINFYCDPTAGRGFVNGTVAEHPTCSYTMNIVTSYACAGGAGGGGSKGLSGGWVFIIILIVCLFVYIVAGCVYQRKKKGASGVESIPNIEFWRGLPGLVKEGFSFTWTKLRGLCGKGEYTEVK